MTFSEGRIREVKAGSFICEVTQALPSDVCIEIIRRVDDDHHLQNHQREAPR